MCFTGYLFTDSELQLGNTLLRSFVAFQEDTTMRISEKQARQDRDPPPEDVTKLNTIFGWEHFHGNPIFFGDGKACPFTSCSP